MRPTEKASQTTYIESRCPTCIFAITVYPPVKIKDNTWDGGFITLATLTGHRRDVHSWTARLGRAWRAWHGCPDTDIGIEEQEDLDAIVNALNEAKAKAFPHPECSGEEEQDAPQDG